MLRGNEAEVTFWKRPIKARREMNPAKSNIASGAFWH
jgi:hypothetical protein